MLKCFREHAAPLSSVGIINKVVKDVGRGAWHRGEAPIHTGSAACGSLVSQAAGGARAHRSQSRVGRAPVASGAMTPAETTGRGRPAGVSLRRPRKSSLQNFRGDFCKEGRREAGTRCPRRRREGEVTDGAGDPGRRRTGARRGMEEKEVGKGSEQGTERGGAERPRARDRAQRGERI